LEDIDAPGVLAHDCPEGERLAVAWRAVSFERREQLPRALPVRDELRAHRTLHAAGRRRRPA